MDEDIVAIFRRHVSGAVGVDLFKLQQTPDMRRKFTGISANFNWRPCPMCASDQIGPGAAIERWYKSRGRSLCPLRHLVSGLAFASPAAPQRFEYGNLVLNEGGIG
jgi:hypothetical protein